MFIAGALTAAVSIHVSPDADTDVDPSSPLFVGATAVTVPASKTTIWESAGGFGSIQAVSAGAEGAARTINVYALLEMSGGE